ncbi:MAG: helicase [Cyanomargarita calcarea GSE-NOS-MK-12-04C]|jgi:SNF2 family DNA or RNA helicase|uniref:Helicase n=1 Tax=Cyanomargarita calcarea GSE-NOS-MK-12-04C TaxID=2839659 RepID=A0A951QN38_9CYAN|nr:helicase [Cyanomargarita calcarea GSE-NOS-MK-12-04C]
MAILHGSWLLQHQDGCLFIWGETWRTSPQIDNTKSALTNIQPHPLAITAVELSEWLHSLHITIANAVSQSQVSASGKTRRNAGDSSLPTQSQTIALPTYISESSKDGAIFLSPIYSVTLDSPNQQEQYLQPWQVEGFCLNPWQTVKFLTSLPLSATNGEDAYLGGDLRFWSQIARWSLDLISRCKFLPTIERQGDGEAIAKWQALLDSAVDGTRLEKFKELMPLACKMYQEGQPSNDEQYAALNLPSMPQKLLEGFLNSTIDAQLRGMVSSQSLVETRIMSTLPPAVRQWLQSLTAVTTNTISAEPLGLERLEAALKAWTMPLQYELVGKSQYRSCFELRSPESEETDWTLAYFLQAADDKEFLVDAGTIWKHPVERLVYQNRTIEQPQETFLRGLGLASRLYPVITASLESESPSDCHITPVQAYEFIKSVAWRFEDSGLGVVLPPSLANRGDIANRLGLKITAQTPDKNQGRLGLQSLLNFEWQLAIGGQTISQKEFNRLVALNSPLVEINGEWVELRAQDIKTAQAFFASRKEQMALSLEDALRLSTGDTQVIEKLPVVSFDASGALHELIGALTNNQAIEPLPTPANFQGQLRPYQERGAAWLAFLERWGLGACLADDMGLGKCVKSDTQIYVNGVLNTAEEIWKTHAGATVFDGEGYWAEPRTELLVNSIDEEQGKIVQAPIRRLYRQQVCEKLRKVTLEDGRSVTITRRHKLLTSRGWTNQLQVGDYVGVPATMGCDGQFEDRCAMGVTQNLPETLIYGTAKTRSTQRSKSFRGFLRKSYLSRELAIAQTRTKSAGDSRQFLQEVFYCKIDSIEDVEYRGWVYDLEVSKYHNFVANNIICHNTVQFIAFLLHLKEEEVLEQPTLLVCPTSVLGNWEREVKKFAPTLKVLQYHGDKRPKGKAFAETVKKYDLAITSYSLLHRDVKSLQGVSWQGIVLDEAQNIKNPDAKQSQAVRQLEATFRIALTGTPVENRLQELWSILDFLNPGYLGNKQFFQRRFAMPIEKYGDSASLNQLRSLVQPFILRRLKSDREIIQDLPDKQEMNVFCGLTPDQATLYQKVVEDSLAEIETASGLQRRGMILALLVKLKQVCNHPAQYLKKNSLEEYHSGKLQRLEEMLEEVILEGDRSLIFTQFAEWGKLLKPYLENQFKREIFFLYGSSSKKQREEMIDRFQHDPQGPPIMILSLKAGGVGLNLTRANHVFHFDRWWNPAVENQATDRVFRIGQTRNVQVHKFVCNGTLEEKIHDMIESKKQLAEQVVGGGEEWLTELDTNQLRNLLLLDRSAVIEED